MNPKIVIKNFTKSVLDVPQRKVNANKDYVIKVLRLLHDKYFWDKYKEYSDIRRLKQTKPEDFKQFLDNISIGNPSYTKLTETIDNLRKVLAHIECSKHLKKIDKLGMKAALGIAMATQVKLNHLENFYNTMTKEAYKYFFYEPIVKFCNIYKYDVHDLHKVIAGIWFHNTPPKGIGSTIGYLEHQLLQKYRCKAIKDTDTGSYFIKIYRNTKKENIKKFIDYIYEEITTFFSNDKNIAKKYKEHGIEKPAPQNIEEYTPSDNFYRDLKIYSLYRAGNTPSWIIEKIDPLGNKYNLNVDLVRKIISDMKKMMINKTSATQLTGKKKSVK